MSYWATAPVSTEYGVKQYRLVLAKIEIEKTHNTPHPTDHKQLTMAAKNDSRTV